MGSFNRDYLKNVQGKDSALEHYLDDYFDTLGICDDAGSLCGGAADELSVNGVSNQGCGFLRAV